MHGELDFNSLPSDIAEEGSVSLTIQCHLCTCTRVPVRDIRRVISDDIASSDLNPVSGIMEFNEGVHQEVLFIQPKGENYQNLFLDFSSIITKVLSAYSDYSGAFTQPFSPHCG